MSNATLRANAQSMPIDRRAALRSIVVAGATLAVPVAVLAADPDAELVALDAKIRALADKARDIAVNRFDPFEDEFKSVFFRDAHILSEKERSDNAWKFHRESGMNAAAVENDALFDEADVLFERLCTIPATTPAGRAAKVRAHLEMTFPREMREGTGDWDESLALLAELAGVRPEEIAIAPLSP